MSLRLKLGLLVAIVASVPVALTGWFGLRVNETTLETTLREQQILILGDLASEIDDELGDAEAGLDSIARVLSDGSLDGDARVAMARATVSARVTLDHAAIYTRDGELMDVIREPGLELELPAELDPKLLEAGRAQRVVTGEAVSGQLAPRVPLLVGMRPDGPDGPTTGYVLSLVSTLGVRDRLALLSDAHLRAGPDALFVVDQQLRLIAHGSPERGGARESMAEAGALAGLDAELTGPTLSWAGEYEDAGQTMVGTVRGLEGRPWIAVAQVPREQAYATLEDMRRKVLLTVLLVMLVAGTLGVFAAQRLTAPLRSLTRFAGLLAQRRFDQRLELRSRDELGVLARAMSAAAADLEASEEQLAREIEIRHDLGRYMPAEIVERVVKREQDMALGGERREISVMFMDVVAFTPLTERLEPERVVELLNHLFTMSTEIVFRHGGTVDKFIGDSMMAFWGAPEDCPDHAEQALSAAEEILSWLEVANQGFSENYGCSIRLAIGVNSGTCVVGNIGSDRRMEYTAIGDVVNVAARLEAIARPQQILVTEATRELVDDLFDFASVGHRELAGREAPIKLFEVRQ